jgi:hypothetical protein
MSDTPRTDAKAQFFGFNPDEGEEFVQIDFARELERENASLRADKERLDWLQNATYWPHPPLGEDIRAAIDAAQKDHNK